LNYSQGPSATLTRQLNHNLFKLLFEVSQLETLFQPVSVARPERVEVARCFVELQQQPNNNAVVIATADNSVASHTHSTHLHKKHSETQGTKNGDL